MIVFAPEAGSVLQRVAQSGGEPVAITALDAARQDDSHRHPRFLPDGRHFLYLAPKRGGQRARRQRGPGGVARRRPGKLLLRSAAAAEYAAATSCSCASGRSWPSASTRAASRSRASRSLLADDVRLLGGAAAQAVVSASADVLVLQRGQVGSDRRLVWRDRAGKELGTLGDPARYMFQAALSPSADAAAVDVLDPSTGNPDIWTYDVARGLRSRFTFDARTDMSPLFSPDGKDVVFYAPTRDEAWPLPQARGRRGRRRAAARIADGRAPLRFLPGRP